MPKFDADLYAQLMEERRHDEAIALVDDSRLDAPDDQRLRRCAALARGAKGEHILQSYDEMKIQPSKARIEEMAALFHDAIDVDPKLADPYWDLAVIHGRFLEDPVLAQQYLDEARALEYYHPMMSALEQLINEINQKS